MSQVILESLHITNHIQTINKSNGEIHVFFHNVDPTSNRFLCSLVDKHRDRRVPNNNNPSNIMMLIISKKLPTSGNSIVNPCRITTLNMRLKESTKKMSISCNPISRKSVASITVQSSDISRKKTSTVQSYVRMSMFFTYLFLSCITDVIQIENGYKILLKLKINCYAFRLLYRILILIYLLNL